MRTKPFHRPMLKMKKKNHCGISLVYAVVGIWLRCRILSPATGLSCPRSRLKCHVSVRERRKKIVRMHRGLFRCLAVDKFAERIIHGVHIPMLKFCGGERFEASCLILHLSPCVGISAPAPVARAEHPTPSSCQHSRQTCDACVT